MPSAMAPINFFVASFATVEMLRQVRMAGPVTLRYIGGISGPLKSTISSYEMTDLPIFSLI